MTYLETFDDGPGGWYGWVSNRGGPLRLETHDGVLVSRSPWWIDYNHAPPGAGYLHLLACLMTRGPEGEHHYETAGRSRFIAGRHPTNFTGAQFTVRLRGELEARGARPTLLLQGSVGGKVTGWLLTGRTFHVTPEWSEQTVVCELDERLWTCLGSRHDRTDMYGRAALAEILRDVNVNLMLVLFPLDVAPMGPLDGEPHLLRPERDYPVWRSRLPEGYVLLDTVRIDFADQPVH